eukprot:scaffold251161_cov23-Prasinocladus_malaysianus.AAC.1
MPVLPYLCLKVDVAVLVVVQGPDAREALIAPPEERGPRVVVHVGREKAALHSFAHPQAVV